MTSAECTIGVYHFGKTRVLQQSDTGILLQAGRTVRRQAHVHHLDTVRETSSWLRVQYAMTSAFPARHKLLSLFAHVRVARVMVLLAAMTAALLMADVVQAKQAGDGYLLDAQDKVRIRVVEWHPGEGKHKEWEALSGEYDIGAGGLLSLPFLDSFAVRGMTTEVLAKTISDRLKERARLLAPPYTSVQIISYRPFYVVGQVERPGEYSYRPDLTTVKAVALAGGTYRGGSLQGNFVMHRINAGGLVQESTLNLRRAYVRRARLLAELEDLKSETIEIGQAVYPPELPRSKQLEELVESEDRIRRSRMSGLKSRLLALKQISRLLQREDTALIAKIELQRKSLELAQKQGDDLGALKQKRLIGNQLWLRTRQTIADAEARLLDLETASLRVKQELSKAQRDGDDARDTIRASVTKELQETEALIDILRTKIRTATSLMSEAGGPTAAMMGADGESTVEVEYKITRKGSNGRQHAILASEDTPVHPGDVVQVTVRLIENDVSKSTTKPGAEHSSSGRNPIKALPSLFTGLRSN
ncbi:MAG: hypothetical protein RLZ98_1285 [Pseudomonadota bacterium]|jgi:exopolysaccharide production protein ExoF